MTELDLDAIKKAYGKNHTELPSSTPLSVIRVFQQVPYLIDEIRRLRSDLDAVRELAGPDNESGFISTDALIHTIGTGENRLGELQAQIQRVRGLHKRAHAIFNWNTGIHYEEPCDSCDGKAGVHDCGCWADTDVEFVCAECHRLGSGSRGVYDYTYPCPTIKALGGDGGNTTIPTE